MSMSSIFAGVETFVQQEVQKGETAISTWWTDFEPIAEADLQKFVTAMQPIALALVTGLAQAAIPGSLKLSTSSSALLATAKAQGLTATKTMADTLVQQIVMSLSTTPPPAAT